MEAKSLQRLYLHDALFELFIGDDGFVLDTGFVGIDRIDGVFEDAGYFFVVVDAHADQGEDAEVGIQEFMVFQLYFILFAEEVIEPLYKIREEL